MIAAPASMLFSRKPKLNKRIISPCLAKECLFFCMIRLLDNKFLGEPFQNILILKGSGL